jgi:hypothetical protein
MKPREIFFSHASVDRVTADKIVAALRRQGLKVWYSKAHLKAAQQWQAEIGVARKRCNWFVVLLTPAAARSKWAERELAYALRQDAYDNHIVPLLLRPCNSERLSWTPGGFQMIKLQPDFTSGMADLLSLCQHR